MLDPTSRAGSSAPASWTTRACMALGTAAETFCSWVNQACDYVERQFSSRPAAIVPASRDPREGLGAAVRDQSDSKASDSRESAVSNKPPMSREEASQRGRDAVTHFIHTSWGRPDQEVLDIFAAPFEGRDTVVHALEATGGAVLADVAQAVIKDLKYSSGSEVLDKAAVASLRARLVEAIVDGRLPREFLAILKAAHTAPTVYLSSSSTRVRVLVPNLLLYCGVKPIVDQYRAEARGQDKKLWSVLAAAVSKVAKSPETTLERALTHALAAVVVFVPSLSSSSSMPPAQPLNVVSPMRSEVEDSPPPSPRSQSRSGPPDPVGGEELELSDFRTDSAPGIDD